METGSNLCIIRKIGEGTFGEVYAAFVRDNPEQVIALKRLRKDSPSFSRGRALTEIQVGGIVAGHPGIVAVRNAFETSESVWMTMEYIDGIDLVDFMEKRNFQPLEEETCRIIFRSIAESIFYCHEKGVAHRDIKLDNVLVTNDLTPHIIDFGMSCPKTCRGRYKRCPRAAGSPEYLAPELARGERDYCFFKADVWSCGTVLYALLFGRFPFSSHELAMLSSSYEVPLRWWDEYSDNDFHVSSSAKSLLRGMLAVDPAKRVTMAEVVHHPWLLGE